MKNVRFIGMDVHAEALAVAVVEPGGEVCSLGTIPNRPEPVARSAVLVAGVKRPQIQSVSIVSLM